MERMALDLPKRGPKGIRRFQNQYLQTQAYARFITGLLVRFTGIAAPPLVKVVEKIPSRHQERMRKIG
jgi:hypothetical protein